MAAKKVAKKQAPKKPANPVAKKAPAKKAPAKKAPAKKAPAKKAPAKKAPAKKAPAKKSAKPVVKKAPTKPAPKKAAKPVVKKALTKPTPKKPAAPVVKKAPIKTDLAVSKALKNNAATKSVSKAPAKSTESSKVAPVVNVQQLKTKVKPKQAFKKVISLPEAPSIIVEPITDPKFLAFAEKQKHKLLDLRDGIIDAMTGSAREAIRSSSEGSEASGSGMHQGDAGSDAYDREYALSVLAKDQSSLYEIDDALQRIKKGLYGLCEMSGKRIPIARLEAIPFARLTVECQAQWEKEHGKRQFRPSGSVGFSGGGIFEEDEETETILLDDDED